MSLRLIGYRHSVYTWAARMALAELGCAAQLEEIDPFDPTQAEALRAHHPFGRVPVLWDGAFRIYETAAILAYLIPDTGDPKRVARARQATGIIDTYGYWPLVRQVFAHGRFRPAFGLEAESREVAAGLASAPPVLAALDEIAAEGFVLDGMDVGAVDCHLAPMIGYFCEVPAGKALLEEAPALSRWFISVSTRDSFRSTRPLLPEPEAVP